MRATLAYLNAAGRREALSTSGDRAFWKVMHSLLANIRDVAKLRSQSSRPLRNTR